MTGGMSSAGCVDAIPTLNLVHVCPSFRDVHGDLEPVLSLRSAKVTSGSSPLKTSVCASWAVLYAQLGPN